MYKSTIAFLSVYGTKDFILHFAANFTLDSHFSYFLQDFCQIHKDSKDTVLILTVFNPLARWEFVSQDETFILQDESLVSRDESLVSKTRLLSCERVVTYLWLILVNIHIHCFHSNVLHQKGKSSKTKTFQASSKILLGQNDTYTWCCSNWFGFKLRK